MIRSRKAWEQQESAEEVRFWKVLATLLAIIAALLILACFSGCAGSALDRDFRAKVSEVDVTLGGSYDDQTDNGTVTLGNRLYFRDPAPTATPTPHPNSFAK